MNRFKWPVKFSSSMKWVKEKLKLLASTKFIKGITQLPKMAILVVFLITILIGANSLLVTGLPTEVLNLEEVMIKNLYTNGKLT